MHLVQAERGIVQLLADNLLQARAKIQFCEVCGGLTERQPCAFCAQAQAGQRDASLICVVERPVDIFSIEKAGAFRGIYHVLAGKISPLNGVEPEDLRVAELEQRCEGGAVKEIIIALPSDVEGDATSFYLNKLLRPRGVKMTRIAQGLAVGSGVEFADELTLSRALEGRREL